MSGLVNTTGQFAPGFLEETRAPQIIAGNVTVQLLGTLIFFGRLYSRLILIGNWKSEDWVLTVAWLLATGYSVCQYGQIAHGSGKHLAATPNMNDAITGQKYAFAAQVLVITGIPMPKVSMCLSYLRIFYSDVIGRRLIYGLLVVLVLTTTAFGIETFFTCQPLDLYWKELRPTDKCLNDGSTFYIHGSVNLGVDAALMGILIPRIMGLKLNNRQKWALLGIVMVGSLAIVAGIIRMVRVGKALSKATSKVDKFDPPWDMYDVSIWTSTELYVTLICAAAPGTKPLVSMLLPKLLGTTLRSRTGNTAGRSNTIELNSKLKRSTLGTRHSTVIKSNSTTNLTTAHGPYSEIHSLGKHDEESLDGKSMYEGVSPVREGIMKNTQVTITSEDRV